MLDSGSVWVSAFRVQGLWVYAGTPGTPNLVGPLLHDPNNESVILRTLRWLDLTSVVFRAPCNWLDPTDSHATFEFRWPWNSPYSRKASVLVTSSHSRWLASLWGGALESSDCAGYCWRPFQSEVACCCQGRGARSEVSFFWMGEQLALPHVWPYELLSISYRRDPYQGHRYLLVFSYDLLYSP